MAKGKGNVVKYLHTVDGLGKILHHKDFVSDLTVWPEVNIWIFTAGRTHVIQLDFSRARLREVACLDLEALALKREINSCSSLIFSSFSC